MPVGRIYTVRSKSHPALVYVGSTTQTLSRRMSTHRAQHRAWVKRGRVGGKCASFQILDVDESAYIELIRTYNFELKDELRREENIEMRKIKCINHNAAFRESKAEIDKAYRATHADAYAKYQAAYHAKRPGTVTIVQCACGQAHQFRNTGQHQRSKFHQEHIAQQQAAAVE